ncbi:hypothetical protein GPECTOR_30g245 [Gonium pectorale]|uniref:EF-hand domain-containing protein n=1 Tax=Gonium pectorale TaxID=33097 RepID=A0A150GE85_GONPE|nr:hypothetical protein GPECTOR_30g245 [Gonium pectorale]|eukprot:KXZ48149.1 hypothetical protein GPECTOR_30g245 [Gonium pectorale]
MLPLGTRQRIFFKYEKRVRDKSTLDKVFEYFSSIEKDKLKFLSPVDLLRAVVPTYPPSESSIDRSGSLDGERADGRPQPFWSKAQTTFFKQFDVDGDGLISYPEFLLVLTLLSIHERDVKIIFDVVDLDSNGYIDVEEFKGVMDLLQAMANVHAAKVGRSSKLSIDTRSGMLVSFFGHDGRKKLFLPQFQAFLTKLHEELVKLEFAHYDNLGRGSMAPVDFAHSLVATADVRHIDRLLDKVDSMPPELLRKRVTFDDFLKVHHMQRKLHTLTVALDFFHQVDRPVCKAEFTKLLKKLMDITLAPHVVDIIFDIFADERGALDTTAFLEVMQRREIMWARRVSLSRSRGAWWEELVQRAHDEEVAA